MKSSLELFIALMHTKKRKRQTLLAVAAIAVAVMVLVVSNVFMVGFTEKLYEPTVEDMTHVTVTEDKEYLHLYRNNVSDIYGVEGVRAVSAAFEGEVPGRMTT
jgi:lipoprotein-releasing system permease protein